MAEGRIYVPKTDGRRFAVHGFPAWIGKRICEHDPGRPVSREEVEGSREGAKDMKIRGNRMDCPKTAGHSYLPVSRVDHCRPFFPFGQAIYSTES